ncbi:hypothetical protein B0H11DRAFT_2250240 [Mycena galericulata]|nr:hypothetical protein B0H11DRAFT_2250240 [Mycena galericulata]
MIIGTPTTPTSAAYDRVRLANPPTPPNAPTSMWITRPVARLRHDSRRFGPGTATLGLQPLQYYLSVLAPHAHVKSLQWTVVVPLPVIVELDGLSANPTQLGEAAQR